MLCPEQGECERGTEWKIEWGKKGHSFELPNEALGKSVKDEFWIGVDIINCNSVFQLQGVFLTGTPLKKFFSVSKIRRNIRTGTPLKILSVEKS